MKTTVIFVSLLMAASLASAQATKPASAPAARPAVQEASAKPTAVKSRRMQDARHCLAQPDNTAIIKCAEAYL